MATNELKCDICNKVYKTQNGFDKHMDRHANEVELIIKMMENPSKYRIPEYACLECNKMITHNSYPKHLMKCYSKYKGHLVIFMSEGILGKYFMFVVIGDKCKLKDIDNFLIDKWCNCCNHISVFEKTGKHKANEVELKKKSLYKDVCQKYINYTYDMGSPTEITIENIGELKGTTQIDNVLIISKNDIIDPGKCTKCKKNKGTHLENCKVRCEKCIDPDIALEIVDSPRTGMCGYE
jgi:hypothetical protein